MKRTSHWPSLAFAAAFGVLTAGSADLASASEDGRNITTGALLGGAVGALATHGKASGIIGGAVVGGVAGHLLTPQHRHRYAHVYYRNGHRYVRYVWR